MDHLRNKFAVGGLLLHIRVCVFKLLWTYTQSSAQITLKSEFS